MKKNGLIFLMVSLFLMACSSNRQDEAVAWMAQEKSQTQPKIQPLREPSIFEPVAYEKNTAINPFSFEKLAQVFATGDVRSGVPQWVIDAQSRRKEPLEAFPLDTMQMVGFMKKQGLPTALISVDSHLYQVVPGNYLGQNFGRIISIEEAQLELKEIVQDASGDWTERSTVIGLQE